MPRQTEKPFNVHINFAGMCMFVRDKAKNRMHVLMPPVKGHQARLFVPREHHPSPPAGDRYVRYPLKGRVLDLTSFLSNSSTINQLDTSIVDLSDLLKKRVPRELLEEPSSPDSTRKVLARVTLDDGEMRPDDVNTGTDWEFGGRIRDMAISGTWTIKNAESLPGDLERIVRLCPGDTLTLYIFNARPDEGPGSTHSDPLPNIVHHFDRFYSLIRDVKPTERKKPRKPKKTAFAPTSTVGTRFTCIMAQAEAADEGGPGDQR